MLCVLRPNACVMHMCCGTPKSHKSSTLLEFTAGEPVSVNVVGGSISAGSGALKPGTGWVLRLFDWIRTTFPVTLPATAVNETTGEEFQRSEHFLKNGACPGTKCAAAGAPRCSTFA